MKKLICTLQDRSEAFRKIFTIAQCRWQHWLQPVGTRKTDVTVVRGWLLVMGKIGKV